MGFPYFVYAGCIHVDELTEEFLGVTLAEQCNGGSSEHVAVFRFFFSPPRDREQRNTTTIVSAAIGTTEPDLVLENHEHYSPPPMPLLSK